MYSQLKIFEMKKIALSIIAACIMFAVIPQQLSAAAGIPPTATAAPMPVEPNTSNKLISRLNVITEMDKTSMSPAEKKDLRQEVRSIKKELKANNGGVYLSVGAVVIIILLIILLV